MKYLISSRDIAKHASGTVALTSCKLNPSIFCIGRSRLYSAALNKLDADAVTGCLRTSANTLSTDVIMFDSNRALDLGLDIIATEGRTPLKRFQERHKDIANLNYQSPGVFASLVVETLGNKKYKRFQAKEVTAMLLKAVREGSIDQNALNEKLRAKLGI